MPLNIITIFINNFNNFIVDNYIDKYTINPNLDKNLITFLKTGNTTSNELIRLEENGKTL